MGCRKTTKKVVTRIWSGIKPIIMEEAVKIVGALETVAAADPNLLNNSTKRSIAFGHIKDVAEQAAVDLKDRTASLVLEYAVELVKGPDEADLGPDDDETA